MEHIDRMIPLSDAVGTRELGGLPCAGGMTKRGAFVRGAMAHSLTEEDIAILKADGVTTIIDLRSNAEISEKPDAFCDSPFEYIHFRMPGDGLVPASPADVPASYIEMIEHPEKLYPLFRAICSAKGCVLFHCLVGKDRTGVLAALLLSLCGVDDDIIVDDFMLTKEALADFIEAMRRERGELFGDTITPRPVNILTMLGYVRENYGTTENYLKAVGMTAAEIENIRSRLI